MPWLKVLQKIWRLYSVLQCVAVCCSVLQCVAVCCSVLQCVAVRCSVLQCVAVRCSVLQCVAVCCSAIQPITLYAGHIHPYPSDPMISWSPMGWLQLVGSIKSYVSFAKELYKRDDIPQKRPIIVSILLTVATPCPMPIPWFKVLQKIWRLHSVLQCVAVCCSVLQCVAVCCSDT